MSLIRLDVTLTTSEHSRRSFPLNHSPVSVRETTTECVCEKKISRIASSDGRMRTPSKAKYRSVKTVKVLVSNPKLHNCSRSKFVDYEINIETNNKAFFSKRSSVRRRYSDFCWLRAKLSSTDISGLGGETSIPTLPPKSYFSRFDKGVIDSRREGFQHFLSEIVKVNNYLSFAGLHLFLQTQLPIQEIEGFLEGKYGENASVEDLIHPTTLSNLNEDKKTLYECSNEDCTLLTSSNWDIPSTDNASTHCGSYEVNSDRLLSDSYSTSSGYLSSSAENSSFMYTMYR
ncbi:sorting nexin-10 isoform X1 [Pocillopora verrucosa]|uniref:sorting nexin-10 isoform X1 n=1 Tax=Pocillopora verrucosa TaxID=203993 RepID=UPI00334172DE